MRSVSLEILLTSLNSSFSLTNLTKLLLYENQIFEVKGLENLRNVKFLNLYANPIPDEVFEEIGDNYELNGQKFVWYCKEKKQQFKKLDDF